MRIKWIEFENLTTGLKINRVDFYSNLTVLVGLSGAGKTQILNALNTMCALATGHGLNHNPISIKASMCFSVDDKEYIWNIVTNTSNVNKTRVDFSDFMYLPFILRALRDSAVEEIIVFEELKCNDKTVFKRDEKETFYEGYEKLPNSNGDTSLIHQYRNNENLKDVFLHLNKLYNFNSPKQIEFPSENLDSLNDIKEGLLKCKTNKDYINAFPQKYPLAAKIYLIKSTNKKTYDKILSIYQESFPEIIDFEIARSVNSPDTITLYFVTQKSKIDFDDISSGMYKMFSFLLDVFTVSSDYVFIMDEIENGLGVNCIDNAYNYIFRFRRDLQFIITSHHPYIINNIKPSQCKIVNRVNNIISTYSSQELNLSNEYYDFFDVVLNKLKSGDLK